MNYNKINNITGWMCFGIALITYVLTLDPTVSFWDCGEFIASAFKMQVVHQPGAPLFLMIERFFSIFAFGQTDKIAYWMNFGSAVASAATILFLFWTITALGKKVVTRNGSTLDQGKMLAVIGAGVVGALGYAYSDSFWFSAVEAEVYALSSLFTAIVFWAILKWEAVADEPKADRWLLFIAYFMGLSIAVHLLSLLTIPVLAFVYYFRKSKNITNKGVIKTFFVGVLILGIIQYGIIQYLVYFAAYFDLFFVNTIGLGFGSGVLVFGLLLIIGFFFAVKYSIKKKKKLLNLALLSSILIIFGYSSFAMIVIRAQANPNLNNSDPDNAFSLLSYLNREQYGDRPLLNGPNYNSKKIDLVTKGTTYRKGEDKYEDAGKKIDYVYDKKTIFPRMYSDNDQHIGYYMDMMGFSESHFPNLIDNVNFMAKYQIGQMYMRYFLWNFAGRQNDLHGQGSIYEGMWLSGVKPVDALFLGDQSNLPPSIQDSNAYNRFYFLPLILGLIGIFWHFKRHPKDAGVVSMLFFFTGLAIVLYLNQKPLEPRERDYAYVGSFYAFAIWIGLGVLAMYDWLSKKLSAKTAAIGATVIGLFAAPIIMASEGWDDHDRSDRTIARDIAIDYLESCAPNAILFTYGDNDTYPLWYAQEVENVRPDIRLVNLSLFDTDWYLNGMLRKQNESAPLPLSMTADQFKQGVRDVLYYEDYGISQHVELKTVLDVMLSENDEDKVMLQDGTKANVFPAKNLKLTINPQDLIKNGQVDASQISKIDSVMKWTVNGNYITKGNLALLDLIANNNWERPIYFASTVPSSQYKGLDNYLYTEGLTKRLLPFKNNNIEGEELGTEELVNTQHMYKNVMNKFVWGNIKNSKYLDPQSQDDVNIFASMFNLLASGLIDEGKNEEAKKVIDKYFEVLPSKFFTMRSVSGKFFMAENLYKIGDKKRATELLNASVDFIRKEITYLADVSSSKGRIVGMQNLQLGMSFLGSMNRMAEANGDQKLADSIQTTTDQLENRFSAFFGQQ